MQTFTGLSWAFEEFGDATLGNKRRSDRLVQVAKQVAATPDGRVTSVFADPADREAAFRFVENSQVDPQSIASASHRACVRRAAFYPFVYVPIDGTSLNIVDWQRTKGLGIIGSRRVGATGLKVMSAIGVAADGTPLGLCGQKYWTRRGRVRRRGRKDMRKLKSKETQHWLDVMDRVGKVFDEHGSGTVPWFQLDRGGDAWPVLLMAQERDLCVTIRAAKNRRLWGDARNPRKYLWEELGRSPVRGYQHLRVSAAPNRQERVAKIATRFAEVTLDLHDAKDRNRKPGRFYAVMAREEGTAPGGERPIEWLLLTTRQIRDVADARAVIDGYAQRWVIEEFHRTWKSGACNVETTQLRACDHILRWATILAAVATRIQRLTKLARTEPELPATVELSRAEIDAIIITKKKSKYRQGETPTIAEAVTWVAEIGGYTGKSSGGPPGATVISRGLNRIQLLAEYLEFEGQRDVGQGSDQ